MCRTLCNHSLTRGTSGLVSPSEPVPTPMESLPGLQTVSHHDLYTVDVLKVRIEAVEI